MTRTKKSLSTLIWKEVNLQHAPKCVTSRVPGHLTKYLPCGWALTASRSAQLCVYLEGLTWKGRTGSPLLTPPQLLLMLTGHFPGENRVQTSETQNSTTYWDKMCWVLKLHGNSSKIPVWKTDVRSKLSLFMTNHSLYITIITNSFITPYCHIFVLDTQMIKNIDLGSNKKKRYITNFMFYFCGIEKAIIKKVKLLTNIQGDSPYTFFPRNLCHLMHSKYIYINIYLHISCKHTFTQSLKIWHLSPSRQLPDISPSSQNI